MVRIADSAKQLLQDVTAGCAIRLAHTQSHECVRVTETSMMFITRNSA
jgi:hypothetical protein